MSEEIKNLDDLVSCLERAVLGQSGSQYLLLGPDLFEQAGALVGYLKQDDLSLRIDQLPNQKLIQPDKAKGEVCIVGKAQLFKKIIYNVIITGQVPSEKIVLLRLSGNPSTDSAWNFADNFSSLPEYLGYDYEKPGLSWHPSFFNDIGISSPVFRIYTYPDPEKKHPEGLSMEGSLDVTVGTLGKHLKSYLPAATLLHLSGEITMRGEGVFPLLDLSAFIPDLIVDRFSSICLRLRTIDATSDDPASSIATLNGSVEIKDLPTLKIEGPLLQGNFVWVLRITLDDPERYSLKNGLSALTEFVGGHPLTLPHGMEKFASFYLDSVTIGLEPKPGGLVIDFLGASIRSTETWSTPFPGLSITDIRTEWQIIDPFSAPSLLGHVSGTVLFGTEPDASRLNVEIGLTGSNQPFAPSVAISAYLDPHYPVSIKRVFKHFTGIDIDLDLDLSALSLKADTGSGTLFFLAQLKGSWSPLEPLITFKAIAFELSHSPKSLSGSIVAQVEIAKLPFAVEASHPAPGQGWRFSGYLLPINGGITLTEFLSNLVPDQWSDMPESIGAIELRGLSASFDTKTKEFAFDTVVGWSYEWETFKWDMEAELSLKSQRKTPEASPTYSGFLKGIISVDALIIAVTYNFDTGQRYDVSFEIRYHKITLKGKMDKKIDPVTGRTYAILTVSLGGVSFGDILEYLVNLVDPDLDFELEAPWNLLYKISFDNLSLEINLTTKTVGFRCEVSVDLGFIKIQKIGLSYLSRNDGRTVDIIIMCTMMGKTYGEKNPLGWDLLNDPAPSPTGSKLLDLRLLALGQHVAITGKDGKGLKSINKVQEAIDALKDLPADPDKLMDELTAEKRIKFDPDSSWLVAADFGILRVDPPAQQPQPVRGLPAMRGETALAARAGEPGQSQKPEYLLSLAMVFNDPVLYGLRIILASEKAKVFQGLEFEILYKKISDTLGVFKSEIKLPDRMRQLEMGAVSITLPVFGIEVYTNGDFKVDLGFPWKMNFSRSFAFQLFVGPVPVLGAGGLYFGKLSSATCPQLPQHSGGNFNPVVIFGLGLQVGLGKNVDKGVLKAGISITVMGILEGIIAIWNPDDGKGGMDQNYYRVQGTIGIIGKLYGAVDFAVVKASVNVELAIYAQITYESYKDITITVAASVKVSASLQIRLLFIKITLSFSFSATIQETFVIENPQKGTPPWQKKAALAGAMPRGLAEAEDLILSWGNYTIPQAPALQGYFVPVLTVADDGENLCYVAMLFLKGKGNGMSGNDRSDETPAPFETLCKHVLRWTVAAAQTGEHKYTPDEIDEVKVSDACLEGIMSKLSGGEPSAPTEADVNAFMGNFSLTITLPEGPGNAEGVVFPMPPDLSMTIYRGDARESYTFSESGGGKNKIPIGNIPRLREYFKALAAAVEEESGSKPPMNLCRGRTENNEVSVASFVYSDYFPLIARQMIQIAREKLKAEGAGEKEKLGKLISSITAEDISRLGGMTSRYMLHGIRLPKSLLVDGNEGDKDFRTGTRGLYDLTGQQFAIPDVDAEEFSCYFILSNQPHSPHAPRYRSVPEAPEASEAPPVPWAVLGDEEAQSLRFDVVDAEDGRRDLTRAKAVKAAVDLWGADDAKPSPSVISIGRRSVYKSQAATYPFRSPITWQSPEPMALPSAPSEKSRDLTIWLLPESLTETKVPEGAKLKMSIKKGRYDPEKASMETEDVRLFGWGALVEVTIKKIPAMSGSPVADCTYELMGAAEVGTAILERLIVAGDLEGAIEDIVVLYRPDQTGGAISGLQSDNASEVSAFIVRSNLTTDTRPPTRTRALAGDRDEALLKSLLNSKSDFVRLLWENSITRSGGYYLYYNCKDKGLPEWIFNDHGEAQISILLTCAETEAIKGYANCAVTGTPIDPSTAVVFAAAPEDPEVRVTSSSDSLSKVAEIYLTSPADVAEGSPEMEFAPGQDLYVNHGTYSPGSRLGRLIGETTRKELQPSQPDKYDPAVPLDLAAWLGISLDDIKAANPRRKQWDALGRDESIILPRIKVHIGSGGAAASVKYASPSELASIFGCFVADIAVENEDLRLKEGESLRVRRGPRIRTACVEPGVLSIGASRVPGHMPDDVGSTDGQRDEYGLMYIDQMFSMLGYRIKENDYFNPVYEDGRAPVLLGLPMGPASDPGAPGDERWEYSHAIPCHRISKDSRKIILGGREIANPYAGIGGLIEADLFWQDVFGNILLERNGQGIRHEAMINGFTDDLIALSRWPAVSSSYIVKRGESSNKPEIVVNLGFDRLRYEEDSQSGVTKEDVQKRAKSDILVYERLYCQLIGSSLSVESSLLKKSARLDGDQLKGWIGFEIIPYLHALSQADNETPEPPKPPRDDLELVRLTVEPDDICDEEIFELSLALRIERSFDLSIESVFLARTEIRPEMTAFSPEDPLTIQRFAEEFEKAMEAYGMKIATGLNRLVPGGTSIWAVRMGRPGVISFDVENPGRPMIFAPRPLSTKAMSGKVMVKKYTRGEGLSDDRFIEFTDIDLDVWLRQFLEAVDSFLSPRFIIPSALLWERYKSSSKETKSFNERLLDAKEEIAGHLSELLVQALVGSDYVATEEGLTAAKVAFNQQMLISLSSFYSTEAAIQFDVTAHLPGPLGRPNRPRIYGAARPANEGAGVSLTTAKISMDDTPGESTAMTFLMQKAKGGEGTGRSVSLDLIYKATHIEHQISDLPGVQGYKASSWLAFVRPLETQASLGSFEVPLVLRAIPTPPSVVSQEGVKTEPGDPAHLKEDLSGLNLGWDYLIEYRRDRHEQQDRIDFTVKFNSLRPRTMRGAPEDSLFPSLATFVTLYQDIERDLESYLPQLDPTHQNEAVKAVESLIALVEGVKKAFERPKLMARSSSAGDASLECSFSLMEGKDDYGNLVVCINLKEEELWPPSVGKPKPWRVGEYSLQETQGEEHRFTPFKKGDEVLKAEDAIKIPGRKVKLPGLNILEIQDAQAFLEMKRNDFTVKLNAKGTPEEMSVADPFIYTTQKIGFPSPYKPSIDSYDTVNVEMIDSVGGKSMARSLKGHITALLSKIFGERTGFCSNLQIEGSYCFKVGPDLPAVNLPVLLMPHTKFEGDEAAISGNLATFILSWADRNQPSKRGGYIHLDMTIATGMEAESMPLIRLHNLLLNIDYISDWPR